MEFDNENSRCVSAGPEPDARVCVILRGEEVEIELKGRSMDLSDAPAPGGYYNFGKIMLDGMVYDVPEPKEEMENEDADDPPAQR